ncbi:MAG: enoyl-CoA hydratase-related protein [Truepera sp.]|nr:enoyl-CoA hydratase-related protein [Truepera sp.]
MAYEPPDDVLFEHLDIRIEESTAVLTLSRPEALNALHTGLLLEISTALELVVVDHKVRALVITGEGRAFAAGADVEGLASLTDAFSGRETSLAGQDVMNSLAALPLPTVAAIEGYALGGGLELALACDLRVASPGTRLGLPEVGLGLIPGYGGTQRLPRLIGLGRALDLILTGRHVLAEEALALGLISQVSDRPLEAALDLAAVAARNAPIALGLAKEAVVRGIDVTLSQGLEIEADLFGLAMTTEDSKEGTRAFLEKRDPSFQGR